MCLKIPKTIAILALMVACGGPTKQKPAAPHIPELPPPEITIPELPEEPVKPEPRVRAFSDAPPPPLPPGAEPTPPPTVAIGVCWDPTPDAANHLITYMVRATEKENRQVIAREIITKATRATFEGLVNGKPYWFHVIARTEQAVESDPSNEIGFFTPRMGIRRGAVSYDRPRLTAPNVRYRLEFKRSLDDLVWNEVFSVGRVISLIEGIEKVEHEVPADEPQMFFNLHADILPEGCAAQ